MKNIVTALFFTLLSIGISSCVSIPKETVTLSQTIGKDMVVMHNAHRIMVQIYYGQIKNDINTFIDDTYSPFIIHFVLKHELTNYQKGEVSLYGSIEAAGKNGSKKATDEAIQVMLDFQVAAMSKINEKRNELLNPIIKQETELINQIDQSYENLIYANSTVTGYLKSTRKVKESQKEALNIIGLAGADTTITNTLIKMSQQINEAVKQGKDIDVQSDDAYKQLEEVSKKIKAITNK